MAALPETIHREAGKQDAAVPLPNGCTSSPAANPDDVTASRIPSGCEVSIGAAPAEPKAAVVRLPIAMNGNSSTTESDTQAPQPTHFSDEWATRHNDELWGTGPDGTYAWRNQADGFFE